MRYTISLLLVFIFLSCEQQKENNEQQAETPKALQENKESYPISFSKRSDDDLVNELYDEKLEELPGLKALEKKFDELNKNKIDSTRKFNDFDSKIIDYYNSANAHLGRMQDSVLKNELKTFLANNRNTYNNSVSHLKNLEVQINKQYLSAIDRRTALKLIVTLNMMYEFGKKNTPKSYLLESVFNDYKTYNAKLDSAITRNK